MVRLKKLFHRGAYRIGIFFDKNSDLMKKAKMCGGVWSQTHKCWYVDYHKENYKKIKEAFDEIIIESGQNEILSKPLPIDTPINIRTDMLKPLQRIKDQLLAGNFQKTEEKAKKEIEENRELTSKLLIQGELIDGIPANEFYAEILNCGLVTDEIHDR